MRQTLKYSDNYKCYKNISKTLDILQHCNIIANINLGEVS